MIHIYGYSSKSTGRKHVCDFREFHQTFSFAPMPGLCSDIVSSSTARPKTPMHLKKSPDPICALDLEKWRIRHGLTIAAACELLGLPYHKWGALSKTPAAPIQDAAVCLLLTLYDQYPETLPLQREPDFLSFMRALGYAPDQPADRTQCASALGREGVAAYRWFDEINRLSRPVERLMEAIQRLPAPSSQEKRRILESTAQAVAQRMGVPDPIQRKYWRVQR